jgi:hypothetical protein
MGLDEHGKGWPQQLKEGYTNFIQEAPGMPGRLWDKLWDDINRASKEHMLGPYTKQPAGVGTGYGFGLGVIPSAAAASAMGQLETDVFGRAGKKADELLSGGVLGGDWRVKGWLRNFRGDYPKDDKGWRAKPEVKPFGDVESSLEWGPRERLRRSAALRRLSAEIVKLDPGRGLGPMEMDEVERETSQEMRRLRGTGRQVRVDTRRRVREQILLRHMSERDKRRRGLIDDYERGEYLGEGGAAASPTTASPAEGETKVTAQLEKIVNNTAAMVAAIGGVERAATG